MRVTEKIKARLRCAPSMKAKEPPPRHTLRKQHSYDNGIMLLLWLIVRRR